MSSEQQNKFSAAASAVGYLYQCRYALLEGVRRLGESERFILSLETLDDVVFEHEGAPPELLQLKHHVNKSADLSDASVDLWKTLRIWSEGITNGDVIPGTLRILVTTSQAASGSVAEYLRPSGSRNVDKALLAMKSTEKTSTNATNKTAYEAFRKLDESQKKQLVDSIIIIDVAPTIIDIERELKKILHFAVLEKYFPAFIERLEGWWLRRAIQHLAQIGSGKILSEEIDMKCTELREQFKEDNLPIDEDILSASIDASGYEDRVFVKQLKLINVGNPRIIQAIRNYYRAFQHRSRWVRDALLYVGELDQFERALFEEWDIYFQRMKDDLGEDATEEAKQQAAKDLYKWVETGSHPPIRSYVDEPSISRGSFHMLSDSQTIGWHAEFRERLKMVLESSEVLL
jgi:hypothetical protein